MKILLPYPSFEESAKAMDSTTLIEQSEFIADAIDSMLNRTPLTKDPDGLWITEWGGYAQATALYCAQLKKEVQSRGFTYLSYTGTIYETLAKVPPENQTQIIFPHFVGDPEYHAHCRREIIKKVTFEYVRANAALKIHDQLGLSREDAELILEEAKKDYFWYEKLNWWKG